MAGGVWLSLSTLNIDDTTPSTALLQLQRYRSKKQGGSGEGNSSAGSSRSNSDGSLDGAIGALATATVSTTSGVPLAVAATPPGSIIISAKKTVQSSASVGSPLSSRMRSVDASGAAASGATTEAPLPSATASAAPVSPTRTKPPPPPHGGRSRTVKNFTENPPTPVVQKAAVPAAKMEKQVALQTGLRPYVAPKPNPNVNQFIGGAMADRTRSPSPHSVASASPEPVRQSGGSAGAPLQRSESSGNVAAVSRLQNELAAANERIAKLELAARDKDGVNARLKTALDRAKSEAESAKLGANSAQQESIATSEKIARLESTLAERTAANNTLKSTLERESMSKQDAVSKTEAERRLRESVEEDIKAMRTLRDAMQVELERERNARALAESQLATSDGSASMITSKLADTESANTLLKQRVAKLEAQLLQRDQDAGEEKQSHTALLDRLRKDNQQLMADNELLRRKLDAANGEIADLKQRHLTASAEDARKFKLVHDENAVLKKTCTDLRASYDQVVVQIEDIRNGVIRETDELRVDIDRKGLRVRELEFELAEARKAAQVSSKYVEQLGEMEARYARLEAEHKASEARAADVEQELEGMKRHRRAHKLEEQAKAKQMEADQDHHKKVVDELRDRNAEQEREMIQLRRQIAELSMATENQTATHTEDATQITLLQRELDTFKTREEASKNEVQHLERELGKTTKVVRELSDQLADYEHAMERQRTEITTLRTTTESVKSTFEQSKTTLLRVETLKNEYEARIDTLESELVSPRSEERASIRDARLHAAKADAGMAESKRIVTELADKCRDYEDSAERLQTQLTDAQVDGDRKTVQIASLERRLADLEVEYAAMCERYRVASEVVGEEGMDAALQEKWRRKVEHWKNKYGVRGFEAPLWPCMA